MTNFSNAQQSMFTLSGSMVALVTPMLSNGNIDWPALDNLVDWHIAQGTHAIVAVGTTGEASTLDVTEHSQVIAAVVKRAGKQIPIIAGTGANSTREAIELTRVAKSLGADAVLLVTPYYNKPTQEGLYQHYKLIAETVDIPQILYNVPGRTGVDLHNDTVIRLASIPNIVGLKDATGDMIRAKALIAAVPAHFAVLSGDDASALEMMQLGGKGNISVTANIAPKLMSQMCQAALDGEMETAAALNQQLSVLNNVMFCESNPIPVKWAMAEMGLMAPGLRLPLTPLAPSFHEKVRNALLLTHLLV